MSMFGKISDEELAAYLEDKLSKEKSAMIDAAMDIDTLEILRVSEKAIGEFPVKKRVTSPSGRNALFASVRCCINETLAEDLCDNTTDFINEEETEITEK